ncbi:unnamed protein product [Heterobilharzia americana]|nr:unnamed protein product [Heterobilharzia americana]CAH8595664.1 unnamed protein product [Heterobilharzia americana]
MSKPLLSLVFDVSVATHSQDLYHMKLLIYNAYKFLRSFPAFSANHQNCLGPLATSSSTLQNHCIDNLFYMFNILNSSGIQSWIISVHTF